MRSDLWGRKLGHIETFGKFKLDFLRQYLPYEHSIPSNDTLRRFFRAIDTTQFQRQFVEWIRAWLSPEVAGKVQARQDFSRKLKWDPSDFSFREK